MRHRLFIAINLPAEVKAKLAAALSPLRDSFPDARFARPENIHITVSFLGYQNDDVIPAILAATRETADPVESPEVRFAGISYGPPGKTPRMLWLVADEETDARLDALKSRLDEALSNRGVRFDRETHRKFHTHATLARFKNYGDLGSIILPAFSAGFTAGSLDLMESHLARRGAEYALLNAFAFGG